MKQGKVLTREQKILLSNAGWNPKEWVCFRDLNTSMILMNKEDKRMVVFNKEEEVRKCMH